MRRCFKQKHRHGSVTQTAFVKNFCSLFPHPTSAKLLAFSACRSWWQMLNKKSLPSPPLWGGGTAKRWVRLKSGNAGGSQGERPGWRCLRPREARCSRSANKQTCDFGLPKSVFFRHFFATRQRNGIHAAHRARVAGRGPRRSCIKIRFAPTQNGNSKVLSHKEV